MYFRPYHSFFYCWIISYCANVPEFPYPFFYQKVSWLFPVCGNNEKVAIYIYILVLCGRNFSNMLGKYLGVQLSDYIWLCRKLPNFQVAVQVCIFMNNEREFLLMWILTKNWYCQLKIFLSYSNSCVVVSHCCLTL